MKFEEILPIIVAMKAGIKPKDIASAIANEDKDTTIFLGEVCVEMAKLAGDKKIEVIQDLLEEVKKGK